MITAHLIKERHGIQDMTHIHSNVKLLYSVICSGLNFWFGTMTQIEDYSHRTCGPCQYQETSDSLVESDRLYPSFMLITFDQSWRSDTLETRLKRKNYLVDARLKDRIDSPWHHAYFYNICCTKRVWFEYIIYYLIYSWNSSKKVFRRRATQGRVGLIGGVSVALGSLVKFCQIFVNFYSTHDGFDDKKTGFLRFRSRILFETGFG